jgi:hypothetical protein
LIKLVITFAIKIVNVRLNNFLCYCLNLMVVRAAEAKAASH